MENKTEIEFTKNIRCGQIFCESAAEYVLPDYNGDVRKILSTSAEVRPSGKFAGGDEVEFSGIVLYEVIYLDPENNLCSVSFTSDYDYSVKCSEENYRDSFADTSVSNYALRLIGPRKIAARASVVGNVRITEAEHVAATGDTFSCEEAPQQMHRRINLRKTAVSEVREREYADSLARLDGAIADEVSVISSAVYGVIDEVSVGDGEITLRGSLNISSLIKNGDSPAYQREKILQIEETVPFAEVSENMQFIPELTVSSHISTINATDFGTEVVFSTVVELTALGEMNEERELVTDAYLKSYEVENKYDDFSYSELHSVISSRENESGTVQRSEVEAEGIREILLLRAVPKLDLTAIEDGKLTVKGEIKYNGVASVTDGDGMLNYAPLKFSVPFERTLAVGDGETLTPEVKVRCCGASATFDASKLYATCLLEICAAVSEEKHINVLSSSKKSDHPIEKDSSKIVVYYPTSDESLFSIAKRFHTTSLKIASDNSLGAEVFADSDGAVTPLGVKKLLIY